MSQAGGLLSPQKSIMERQSTRRWAVAFGALTTLLIGPGGCRDSDAQRSITVSGITYRFPKDHVGGFVPDGNVGPYVRLRPPGENFSLVYSKDVYRPNEQGPNVPTIAHVNHVPRSPTFQVTTQESDAGLIVCFSETLRFGCGLRITDKNVPWSLLFSSKDAPQAVNMAARAERHLSTYRR
jgi:hypothetical protein